MLVFAQMKGMLDLVERDVLIPAGVSFLRLDGSLEATSRCDRHCKKPVIDILYTAAVKGAAVPMLEIPYLQLV